MTQDQADEVYISKTLPRVGLPHEVANVTVFLATDEARYRTGSECCAGGGWNAGMIEEASPQL